MSDEREAPSDVFVGVVAIVIALITLVGISIEKHRQRPALTYPRVETPVVRYCHVNKRGFSYPCRDLKDPFDV